MPKCSKCSIFHLIIMQWSFPENFIQIQSFLRKLLPKIHFCHFGLKISKCQEEWVKMVQNGPKKNVLLFFLRIEWFRVKKINKSFLTFSGPGVHFWALFGHFFEKWDFFRKICFYTFLAFMQTSCKELGKSFEPFSRAPPG